MTDSDIPAAAEPASRPEPAGQGLSPGLFYSVGLILVGVSIGVFWREVFHLTIQAVEALR